MKSLFVTIQLLAVLALSFSVQAQSWFSVIARKKASAGGGAGTNPTAANLIAWWDMEESSGTRDNKEGTAALDLSESGGTISSTTGLVGSGAVDHVAADSRAQTTLSGRTRPRRR